jgi:cytochrome c oxidase assembly protein subunit 15
MTPQNKKNAWLAVMLGATVLSTYLLMVMGTFVTSTGSGLACPDWPLCYGTVAPPLEMSIWFEWGHRLLGGISGILMVLSTIFVWRMYRGLPRVLMLGVLAFLGFGVLLGGLTVLVEAPLLESFSHVLIISSHLVIATLVLTFLVFTLGYMANRRSVGNAGLYKLIFGAVYLQVLIGILVRYSGATLACPDFPACNGAAVPDFTHYTVALQFGHRVVALAVFLIAAVALSRAMRSGEGAFDAAIIFALVVFQAFFGAAVVLSGMFLPFIILHAANGFLLLGYLAYRIVPHLFSAPVDGAAREAL